MACPKCKCKVSYPYDGGGDDCEPFDDCLERCAACGEVFSLLDEADDDDGSPCDRCGGDGRDPMTDHLLPCPSCGGEEISS